MRAFLNLPVGLKLAASGLIAIVMLGGLAGTVYATGSAIKAAINQQARTSESGALLAAATAAARDTPLYGQALRTAQSASRTSFTATIRTTRGRSRT